MSAAAGGSFMAFLDDPAVREWAAKKHQHAACLNAELEDPLNLERQLRGFDRFVVHPSVLTRFEKILAAMGGPRERRRWEEQWRHRVEVLSVPENIDECAAARRARVRELERITKPQLDAFELGETATAKTFTANGRAVLSAAEQGVILTPTCIAPYGSWACNFVTLLPGARVPLRRASRRADTIAASRERDAGSGATVRRSRGTRRRHVISSSSTPCGAWSPSPAWRPARWRRALFEVSPRCARPPPRRRAARRAGLPVGAWWR